MSSRTVHHSAASHLRLGPCIVAAAAALTLAACDDGTPLSDTDGGDSSGAWTEGDIEFRSELDAAELESSAEEGNKARGSAITVCGSSCPSGQHVAADVCTSSCPGWGGFSGCVARPFGNAVRCAPDEGSSFSSCEPSCPAGYHSTSDTCRSTCDGYSGFSGCVGTANSNSVSCARDAGSSFQTCDFTCPSGYAHTGSSCSSVCDGYSGIGGCVATTNTNRRQCTFSGGGCAWDPGTTQYCDDCGPCEIGEGQCTNNGDCADGLGCYGGICDQGVADGEISASPQVVQVTGSTGSTQITAYVEFAENPQIWVSRNGNPRTLFAGLESVDEQGGSLTQTASWILAGSSYTFTLFADGNGSEVLDTVTVTGAQACTSAEYEYQGVCHPKPVLTMTAGGGGSCSNFGVAHGAPDYLVRTTITGRPGATFQMYNRQTSCGTGNEVAPESGGVIPSSGVWSSTINAPALSDCSLGGIYGRWAKYVVVDGRTSNTPSITYYNSQCGDIATCGLGFSYCEGDDGTTTGSDTNGDIGDDAGDSDPF